MARHVFWGEDHTVLGEQAFQAVGGDIALGITRGQVKKRYQYTDPNEDVVAAAVGERATLLLCADGHNGFRAPRAAVEKPLELLGDDPPPADLGERELHDLWVEINEAVFSAAYGTDQPQSRTTLVLALTTPDRLQWSMMGDSIIARARDGRVDLFGHRMHRFVGWPASRDAIERTVQHGREPLAPGDCVILASDGFADFVADPLEAIRLAVAAGEPEEMARRLVRAACEGGAGDNVAVVVQRV